QDPFSFVAPKENGSCTPKEKALWRIAEDAEKALRRAKIESTVRYASLPLLQTAWKRIRFSDGALVETNLLLQQASMWLLGSSICFASAAAALVAETIQISHAGDRRKHQRIIGDFSFGHPKPFSFLQEKKKSGFGKRSLCMNNPSVIYCANAGPAACPKSPDCPS
ncbi:MAG: hypothetical protein IKC04_03500, partial [Oscillospiraceae bacterium]|nr:hypothetical protein [Oscillospiraceae bacterium]